MISWRFCFIFHEGKEYSVLFCFALSFVVCGGLGGRSKDAFAFGVIRVFFPMAIKHGNEE